LEETRGQFGGENGLQSHCFFHQQQTNKTNVLSIITMDIPIVKTRQQIREEHCKQHNELEEPERQRAYIAMRIACAIERNKKSIFYNNDLYPEVTKELEEKGYQCIRHPSVTGQTTIYFEWQAERKLHLEPFHEMLYGN
jgi:hypothetical protein